MTATTKFLAGARFNLLARGRVYAADEHIYYPKDNAFDGDPGIPVRATNKIDDWWIKVDLNLLQKADGTDAGTFESFTGNVPDGWSESSSGGGIISAETVDVHGGLKALKCAAPSNGSAGVLIHVTVPAGETQRLDCWMKSKDGGVARVRIFNEVTGHYLNAKGGWQVPAADCQTETNMAAWENHKQTFTVEDFATSLVDEVTLTIRLYNSTPSAIALFDDFALYPGANFFSFHGNNLEPRISVLWQYSDNDGGVGDAPSPYTIISTVAPRRPSFYATTTTLYRRWIKWTLSGTPFAAPVSIGELVLGQYRTLLTDAQHPALAAWTWDGVRPQISNVTQVGKQHRSNLTDYRQRTGRLPYFTDEASFTRFRGEILDRCQDGALPMVLVPDDSKPDVIFGQIPAEFSDRQGATPGRHSYELVLAECPFGLSGL